jgi:ribosomal protein L40E
MPEATPDLVRCQRCGAGNPAGASWCGQCHQRFHGAPGASRVEPIEDRPAVTRAGDSLTWTCPACDATNDIEAADCVRCGSSFASFFVPPEPVRPSRVPSRRAVALSAALPGLGHWALGRSGEAIARGLLYVWTVGLSVLLLARPPAGGRAVVRAVGALFLLAASGVWIVSMLETMRIVDGDERPMLPKNALTWLTAGLSIVLCLGLLGAVLAGRPAP